MKLKNARGIFLRLLLIGMIGFFLVPLSGAEETEPAMQTQADATVPIEEEVVETETGIYYTVKKGDTLWDLSQRFSDSPYYWPDLWSENNQIANPHLIYPGQRIRLYRRSDIEEYRTPEPEETEPEPVVAEVEPEPEPEPMEEPPVVDGSFRYSRIDMVGFVRKEPAMNHGTIFKVRQPKEMISSGDIVYIRPANRARLIPGTRYTIYRTLRPVLDPITKKDYGVQHYILGVLDITQTENKYSIAKVTRSFGGIKVGDKIMPFIRRSPSIGKIASQPNLTGKIIMAERRNSVIGDKVIAFIDRGERHGVRPGQKYSIFYQETGRLDKNAKVRSNLDTVDYGELIVVHTEENTSTVFITKAQSNIAPGALIRTPYNQYN